MPGDDPDPLTTWLTQRHAARARRSWSAEIVTGLRFAFYGRTSTSGFQDPATSRAWQVAAAAELVDGHGVIVCEYFDVGISRETPWAERPQAAALLAAITGPDRDFDALVVGEYERAFCGRQLTQMESLLARNGMRLWLPEAEGPVDPHDPTHQALMMLLGAQSRREVLRSRYRTVAAMRAQAREQGRFLGGRPPYGYRIVDAGPHPNRVHSRWGRRLHRLEPDPETAPVVRWMFAQRLTGRSFANIARSLNERRVPCPSGADRQRNSHRSGEAWVLRTVAEILANPRYTGRQVWNRRPSTATLPRGEGCHPDAQPQRAISRSQAHTGLVTVADFIAVQRVRAARPTTDGRRRSYPLSGLIHCWLCGRRMDAHWANRRPGYRCRHGRSSDRIPVTKRRKYLYMRQDQLVAALADQLPELGGVPTAERIAEAMRARNHIIAYDGVDLKVVSRDAVAPHWGLKVNMG